MPVAKVISVIPDLKQQKQQQNNKIFLENSPFQWWLSEGQSKLPPEIERDNVEYKWKLTGMSEERRVHLVTQMRWRVGELGHCWVKDNGDLDGIDERELESTLSVIKDLVTRANLAIESTEIVPLPHAASKFICQVRIELEASDRLSSCSLNADGMERRVLFLGAAGSGKTTLLSVLSDWGSLDDGKGKMRTRLLHHRHELLSGTTSSVTHQPLVFLRASAVPLALTDDSVLLQLERRREVLGEGRVVQLVDSAGKLRFDRTVFSVLTSAAHSPDFAFIVLEAPKSSDRPDQHNKHNPPDHPDPIPIPPQTLTTFRLLEALAIPVAILITKIDQSSTEAISELLESFSQQIGRRRLLEIYDQEGGGQGDMSAVPVLLASAVRGDYLASLAHFLHSLHASPVSSNRHPFLHAQESASSALIIEQVAHLADVGTVVYGQVAFGSICVGDAMVLGPQPNLPVTVKSIQRLKCPVNQALPSQHVSIALDSQVPAKKGMALLHLRPASNLCLKPLRRILAELEQISGNFQSRFTGILYVMGQRFPATLDVQPRPIRRAASSTPPRRVCLVSFSERRPANVFLFPSASIVFVGNGRREKFAGKVIDYFA